MVQGNEPRSPPVGGIQYDCDREEGEFDTTATEFSEGAPSHTTLHAFVFSPICPRGEMPTFSV